MSEIKNPWLLEEAQDEGFGGDASHLTHLMQCDNCLAELHKIRQNDYQ